MSTFGVGASGFLGVAAETVSGTYVAPTDYALIRNESLAYDETRIQRRPLRGVADLTGLLGGNVQISGDLQIEVLEDTLVQLLRAARGVITKGGAGPFTYTFKPSQAAAPTKTLSITVVRNGVVFGYVGCVVSSMSFTTDGGLMVGNFSILGRDEASQSLPTPSYPTLDPFSPGMYAIEVPTTTQVFDTDQFTFAVNDNAESQYRLKGAENATPGSAGTRGAQFVKFGERTAELTLERDFLNRTDYDAFKALTSQSITVRAKRTATQYIEFLMEKATPQSYEITGLTGQAELIRAGVNYQGVYNPGTTQSYQIKVASATSITIP